MKKFIWFLIIVSVVMTIVEGQTLPSLEDWAYDQWSSMSETQKVSVVWAFMHLEENQIGYAAFLGLDEAYDFLTALRTVGLSVGEVVDLISDYYRRYPDKRHEPVAIVYMRVGIRSQEILREGLR